MGSGMTGFLGGFMQTQLALQERNDKRQREAQEAEMKKQDLDLRRKILQGQEASREIQDREHQLSIYKMLQEMGQEQQEAQLLSKAAARSAAPPSAQPPDGLGMETQILPNADPSQPAQLAAGAAPAPRAQAQGHAIFNQMADQVGAKAGVHPDVVRLFKTAVMPQETANYNSQAVSPKGAQGLGQLMPGTAREMGVTDPMNPVQNIDGSLRYLQKLYTQFSGDVPKTLAAYNAGPGNVALHNGVPPFPETQAYVQKGVAAYGGRPSALVRQPSIAPASPEMGRMNAEIGALDAKEKEIEALLAESPGLRRGKNIQKTLEDIRKNRAELEKQRFEMTKEERPKFTPEFTDYVIGEAQQRPEVLFTTPEGKQQLQGLRHAYRTEKLQERIQVSAAQGKEAFEREQDKRITPQVAQDLGLPAYAFTQREVAAMGIIPLSADLQKQIFTAQGTSHLLDRFEDRANRLFKGITPESRLGETGKKLFERFAQTNPDVAVYNAMAEGFLANFARVAGEVGTLAEGDVGRARSLVPKLYPPDTEEVARQKLQELRTFVDDKLKRGRQGVPRGGAGSTAAPAAPATPAGSDVERTKQDLLKEYGVR